MDRLTGILRSKLTKGSGFRLVVVIASSLVTTLGVIYTNYYSYWKGTIYRTQTVDFNILSNLLSTKISILLPKAISSKDAVTDDLQQTIDSNYGLFGLIITDCKTADRSCPNQKILFASQSTVEEIEDGKQKVIPKNDYAKIWTRKLEQNNSLDQALIGSSYIFLYNPPPLIQEWGFQSPRSDDKVYLGKNNGDIIGRVYLLRADGPSFGSEIQAWRKDIPNSFSIGNAKTGVSSRNLVYNSIAISTIITGSLVFLTMEFAYCVTRVAQENEAKAIKEKLNTEQKLRNSLDSFRKANKKKLEAEETARIAAEKSEQAIQEKIKAEEAARAINQQAIQEKIKAEEAARIAAEKSEQATQEKIKAEEAARIAAEKSEQATQEKLKAEEAARIAAGEREHARKSEMDLYNDIEMEMKKATRELEAKVEDLEKENSKLIKLMNSDCKLESDLKINTLQKSGQDESKFISFELTEKDFYSSERRELILDILKKNVNNIHADSRQSHVLLDLVKNNTSTEKREALKAEIKSLFRDYSKMNSQIRNELERMGFEIISEKKHYKIRFHEDNRYSVTFAKTSSDRRAGMNIAKVHL